MAAWLVLSSSAPGSEQKGQDKETCRLSAKLSHPVRFRQSATSATLPRLCLGVKLAPAHTHTPLQVVSPEVQARLMHMVLEGVQELVRIPHAWLFLPAAASYS
jgi:hypothetical protein